MPWSSNATYLVRGALRRATSGAGDLQARARRAPAVGLPRRARPPRGGRLRAVRGARLGPRAADHPARTGRSAPARCSSSSTPTSSSTTSRSTRTRSNHDQLRAMCAFDLVGNNTDRKSGHCLLGARRPHLRHRPRPDVPPRVQAAHGDLGVRRRARPGADSSRPSTSWLDEALPEPLAGAARPVRAGRRARPSPGAACGPAASRSTRPAAATPGRSCERYSRGCRRRRRPAALAGEPQHLGAEVDAPHVLASEPRGELLRRARAG